MVGVDEDPLFILVDLLVALGFGLADFLEDLGLGESNRGMISSGRMV